ncbi:GNAT family N-acetyltransferase [Jeongeupia naejangsanensis]|uniref:GNAT family N-acetyltransferase n=1 Tax=Jeongeupia naejangsanensis TaxID=613195 RepID=A0ABS2BLI6_9NEIS|nr:GNAT family N-acetyltransferase [Jeongeupia naejangsanensis]MBM3116482.1 GNAT family N-acetyltransferase [Jeongeupia naejangsanensis]
MISEASSLDFPFIEKVTRQNMAHHYTQYGMEWQDEAFLQRLTVSDNFVVLDKGERVAVIRITASPQHLYINDLQVIPAAQRNGIGTRLLDHAMSLAKTRNLEAVRLCVFKGNSAKKFYEKLGFDHVGEQGNVLRMERRLEACAVPG